MLRCRYQLLDRMMLFTSGGESYLSHVGIADDRVIPVVVAKCGLYLKEHGTEVEGAFRISGSSKRMRELQTLFDTGPKVSNSTFTWEYGLMIVRKESRLEDLKLNNTRRSYDIPSIPHPSSRINHPQRLLSRCTYSLPLPSSLG